MMKAEHQPGNTIAIESLRSYFGPSLLFRACGTDVEPMEMNTRQGNILAGKNK